MTSPDAEEELLARLLQEEGGGGPAQIPMALSIFVGQQLTSIGGVQSYEYQDPTYVPSCTFRT